MTFEALITESMRFHLDLTYRQTSHGQTDINSYRIPSLIKKNIKIQTQTSICKRKDKNDFFHDKQILDKINVGQIKYNDKFVA